MALDLDLREDIPQIEKEKPEYFKKRLDLAESVLKNYGDSRTRMTRLFDGYNGIKPADSLTYLERTYGKQNKSKYVSYRLGRTKIDLMQGEWLKRPLQATVTTINSDAMNEKMQAYDFMKGLIVASEEVGTLKEVVGVDVTGGMPIPKNEGDPIWQKMSFKDKCEDVMQIILDDQVKELGAKKKLSEAFKNVIITNFCFIKLERNERGEIELHNIDPRDAIFESIEGDDYMEKSSIMGCRQSLPVNQILLRYTLTKEQRDTLNQARKSPDNYIGASGSSRGYMRMTNGELCCDIIHIEWKSVKPEYYKIVPKTASQLMLDPSEATLRFPLDTIKYEANIDFHNKNVADGLYEIETKFMEEEYEATRIGGLIDVDCRRTYFQKRSVDKPAYILSSSYFGYIHGRVNGVTVSVQQMIENFENIYDICMYQIMKEFSRMKGRILTIDRAGLGQKQKMVEVLYSMLNDQVLDYDSSAAGNASGRNLDPANMFKQFDMGLSESFQYLLATRNDIVNQLNEITGINENRMGITAASSTATAQQSNIQNSRTITEALFYGFSGLVSKVMSGIVDSAAISWAFYKLEKGEQILGSEKFRFLKATRDIGYRDYGVYMEDGTKYMEISEKIDQMISFSLNAKEMRPMDAMNVLLADTLAEKKAKFEASWTDMQKNQMIQQQQQQQSDAAMQQQQLQTQIQIAQENREDTQKSRVDEIYTKGDVQIEVDNNKARNEMVKNQMSATNDIINSQDVSK